MKLMRRLNLRRRDCSRRPTAAHLEILECRRLLSAEVPANWVAQPYDIYRSLTPAQVAAIPKGYTLDNPTMSPDGGGPKSPALSGGYTPAQIRHVYGVDQLPENGAGQTIAIVDAYSDPTVQSDLALFDTQFGLPAANLVVAQPEGVPPVDAGWDTEISLDVQWVHSIAPAATILLVEALSSGGDDLYNAVSYAAAQGAAQISMSWGGGEYQGEQQDDLTYFDSPGVTYFASAGDDGGEISYPAESPYVVSVGGTSVYLTNNNTRLSESAWSSGGGGPSALEPIPSYQSGFFSNSTFRGSPDVSMNADPNTGVYIVYDGSFGVVGGTSESSPMWAGLASLANQGRAANSESTLGDGLAWGTHTALYDLAGGTSYSNPKNDFYDVTTGNNTYPATTGYDLTTGLGSPVAQDLIPDLINQFSQKAPTIVVPATATPSTVVGKTTELQVLAADALGESTLTYTWAVASAPQGAPSPTFATNDTNASKADLATFYQAGTYIFRVTATDPNKLTVSSSVTVTVKATQTSLGLTPSTLQLAPNTTATFAAVNLDQFGNAIGSSSLPLTWSIVSGGGTVSSTGVYKAPATGTIATVKVSAGGFSSTATVYVLSSPWLQQDVGSPGLQGYSANPSSSQYTMLGSGTGAAGTVDQFQYAYLSLAGNSTLEAQVSTIQNTSISAEAGLAYRTDTTAGAPNVSITITPNRGLVFSYRSQVSGNTISTTLPRVIPGDYVKLVRVGNIFTGYYSTNGSTWIQVAVANVSMGISVDGGLMAASGIETAISTATFNNVLGDATPTITQSASANPNPVTTTMTTLSVSGGDAAGQSALFYTWTTTALPAGAFSPTFATNGTNASNIDTVTFTKAGTYSFSVLVSNALGYSATSTTTVTVVPTQTSVGLTPTAATVIEGHTQQLTAAVYDQFGLKMPNQPRFTFSIVAGGAGGTVSSQGVYTAPNRTGKDIINVTSPTTAATATMTVIAPTSPAIVLGNSGQVASVGQVVAGWGSDSAPLVTATDGLRLLPVGRQTDIPWANLKTLTVSLNQAVPLTASDVKVTGISVANYGPATVSLVPGTTSTYLISLAQPISQADRVTLAISGLGIATYTRRLDVLPGDINDDGIVDQADASIAESYVLSLYLPADITGSGKITTQTVKMIQLLNGTTMPLIG